MPKKYVLKNDPLSPDKINRLVKQIQDQAKEDREKAQDLYNRCTEALESITSNEELVKVVQAAIQSLGQMSKASDLLLKIVALVKKGGPVKGKGDEEDNKSIFAKLSELT